MHLLITDCLNRAYYSVRLISYGHSSILSSTYDTVLVIVTTQENDIYLITFCHVDSRILG